MMTTHMAWANQAFLSTFNDLDTNSKAHNGDSRFQLGKNVPDSELHFEVAQNHGSGSRDIVALSVR
jgi:hypothetical protein